MILLKEKVKAILITIILCTTSIIIIHNNTTNVTASEKGGEGSFLLSSDTIHRVTENLSNVIYTAYDDGDFRKGRSFGSKGERYAAEYLYDVMNSLDLSNVHKNWINLLFCIKILQNLYIKVQP